jgi:aminomethyltransferase
MKNTPLYKEHVSAGGKIVEFGGWQLPVHYGSLVDEHHAVRTAAGMFDVSHMTIVDFSGPDTTACMRHLLCNDVASLSEPGAAMYSCMLDQQGGIVDDLIVYFLGENHYRMVVNAATRDKDLQWFKSQCSSFNVEVTEQPQLAMVAVQGPDAVAIASALLPSPLAEQCQNLERFKARWHNDWFVATTGYTGEDGYEIALPASDAPAFWQALAQAGVKPCGLGARDTLRLEAGMNLYGTDMTEADTPLTSGLAWTVAWEPDSRDFIGRSALAEQKSAGVSHKMVGYVLEGKGVLRGGQLLYNGDDEIGVITSGTFSPTLKQSIAFARVKSEFATDCEVQIRKNRLPVKCVSRVFVRNGQPVPAVV